ncbi:HAD-IIB family hydrolase [Clostridium sp. JNZ J1-5]
MYKLIAIDIDGTLLKNNKTISPENFQAVKKAKEKGVKIVLSTGRPIQGLEKYSQQLGLSETEDYGIACSGGFIKCLGTNEVIFESTLKLDEFKYLYALSKKLKITLNALTRDVILTPTLNLTTQIESFLSNLPMKITNFDTIDESTIINRIVYINETENFASHLKRVIKRNNINYNPPSRLDGNESLSFDKNNLPNELLERFTVLRPSSNTLEILKKGVNKGTSVNLVAEKFDIKPDEIICIGDSDNDLDMIKYAGLGVAMGNAPDEVKSEANYITYTNEENGLAHVINKFILEENEEKAV